MRPSFSTYKIADGLATRGAVNSIAHAIHRIFSIAEHCRRNRIGWKGRSGPFGNHAWPSNRCLLYSITVIETNGRANLPHILWRGAIISHYVINEHIVAHLNCSCEHAYARAHAHYARSARRRRATAILFASITRRNRRLLPVVDSGPAVSALCRLSNAI